MGLLSIEVIKDMAQENKFLNYVVEKLLFWSSGG